MSDKEESGEGDEVEVAEEDTRFNSQVSTTSAVDPREDKEEPEEESEG